MTATLSVRRVKFCSFSLQRAILYGGLRAIARVQFFHNIAQMHLDRAFGYFEIEGDVLVFSTGAQALQDVAFTRREILKR